jgi:hypothetical protein
MRADRIGGVGRTGRQIAALTPDEERERPFVELDQGEKAPGWKARRHENDQVLLWIKDRAKGAAAAAHPIPRRRLHGVVVVNRSIMPRS